jgi:hypothetical protein
MNTNLLDKTISFYKKKTNSLLTDFQNKSPSQKNQIKKELLHLKAKIEWEIFEIKKYLSNEDDENA